MRIAYGTKIFAILFTVAMADAVEPDANKVEAAKDALHDVVTGGVSEHPTVHEPVQRQRKPRVGNMGVRQSWKQCVGMGAEEAIQLIKNERPDLKAIKVYEGTMVTMDMRMDRVRVFCNVDGIVVRAPRVG